MSNNSNAPFVSTKKYPLVSGESNSPFTDQRAVETGGGGGSNGNVVFSDDSGITGTLKVSDGTNEAIIKEINQGIDDFTIKNDTREITLDSDGISLNTTDLSKFNILMNSTIGDWFTVRSQNVGTGTGLVATTFKISEGTYVGAGNPTIGTGRSSAMVFENFIEYDFAGNVPNTSPLFAFRSQPNGTGGEYYQFLASTGTTPSETNVPLQNSFLTVLSGSGTLVSPYLMQWRTLNIENLVISPNPLPYAQDVTRVFNIGTDITRGNTVQLRAETGTFRSTLSVESGPQEDKFNLILNSTIGEWFNVTSANVGTGTGSFATEFKISEGTYGGAGNTKPTGRSSAMVFENFIEFDFAGTVPGTSPLFAFRSQPNGASGEYYQFLPSTGTLPGETNVPLPNSVLTVISGSGTISSPYIMQWIIPSGGGGGTANSNLVLNYDTTTSTLILSDPVDNLPVISTTQVVPGRTVLIKDVIVNGTTELSALGLSNSIFPPPLEGQTGYWDGLIGNSPPRVSLNPTTGLTNWFPGASFKITLAGEITKIGGYDDIILKVYSNRGQSSQNILNQFTMITRSVQPPPKVGWNWVIDFTCRSINDGGILGVIATSSAFNYTDDTYVLENLGAIVSNTNSSFDTSTEQFLDCTIEFDYYNNSNNIKTTLCTIERIF